MMKHPFIPDGDLIRKYPEAVEALRAGASVRGTVTEAGICCTTVCFIRAAMARQGVVFVRRRDLTPDERLEKYAVAAFWLRAGRTIAFAAERQGASVATVQLVKRALAKRGELKIRKRVRKRV